MVSIKRSLMLFHRPRYLRVSLFHNPSFVMVLGVMLTTTCVITLYSRSESNPSPFKEENIILVHQNYSSFKTDEKELSKNNVKYAEHEESENENNVVTFNEKDIYNTDHEDKKIEDNHLFGNLQISINADKDSVLSKALTIAESITSGDAKVDGPSIVNHLSNLAKGWQSMSQKFDKVRNKIEKQNVKEVQGFVDSLDIKTSKEDEKTDEEPPIGPEMRQSGNFEKQMQEGNSKPTFFNSIVSNFGPAVLAGFDKSSINGGGFDLQKMLANIGPKIISESFGGGSDKGIMSFLQPVVKSVIQGQNGDKRNENSAVSSVMGVIGNLAPLLNAPVNGESRSVSDTLAILKPVLSAMAPSIMQKILFNKQKERKYMVENPLAGGVSQDEDKTIIDQMLNGMDEKTVGQAVGRVLSSVVIKSIPSSLRIPSTSSIRNPYDMVLNLVMGNPRKNVTSTGWNWIRKMAGVSLYLPMPSKWIVKALKNPKRNLYKEDIRHFYGLIQNYEETCSNTKIVGGVYDWKMNKILESRVICRDDIYFGENAPKFVLSFGSQHGRSFEEEIAKEINSKIYLIGDDIPADNGPNLIGKRGKLIPSNNKIQDTHQHSRTLTEWLEKLNLVDTQINLVKIDQSEGGWQILRSFAQNNEKILRFISQLSISVDLEAAIRDPSLYSEYIGTLDILSSYGFQLFDCTSEGLEFYNDPLIDNKNISLQYQIGLTRI